MSWGYLVVRVDSELLGFLGSLGCLVGNLVYDKVHDLFKSRCIGKAYILNTICLVSGPLAQASDRVSPFT